MVLVVNFTSQKHWQDQSCVLYPGDHFRIDLETVMYYAKSKIETNGDLDAQLASGRILLYDKPVTADILDRIRQGAAISDRMPFKHRMILVNQGLIAP